MITNNSPIGIFDSGIGGFTVVRTIRQMLPAESIIYLGDTARVPYGSKSHNTIMKYTIQAGKILSYYKPKLIIIACNTATAHGLNAIQSSTNCPVIGVIEPVAKVASTINDTIGVIGTLATIQSSAYEKAIKKYNSNATIYSLACPLLVSLAEEGWLHDPITDAICRRYLKQIPKNIHTIVLGCTHYPILIQALSHARPNTIWLDSGRLTAVTVTGMLQNSIGINTINDKGSLNILLTDASSRFREVGERFLSEKIESIKLIDFP